MTAAPVPSDMPDVAPGVATKVQAFAELLAAGEFIAGSTAMITWVNDCSDADQVDRTRYFTTTAVTLAAIRIRAGLVDLQRAEQHWAMPRSRARLVADDHQWAMCRVVEQIANGDSAVALNVLTAYRSVHGTAGLFWLGVFAVRLLADLIANETRML